MLIITLFSTMLVKLAEFSLKLISTGEIILIKGVVTVLILFDAGINDLELRGSSEINALAIPMYIFNLCQNN